MFALEGGEVIQAYSQDGNLAYFTCFKVVKYAADGGLSFVLNEDKCERFSTPMTVFFEFLDIRSRHSVL